MCNKIKQIYKGFSTCGFDSFFWRVILAQPFTIPDSTLEHFWCWLDSPVGQWGQWEWGDRADTASDNTIRGATDGP